MGQGDGHLETLMFRTMGGFYDPSGERTTAVEAAQIRYIDSSDATESTVDVSASIGLRLDLACGGDFDADGSVGFTDFLSMVNAFNTSAASLGWTLPSGSAGIPLRRLDANGDDLVDFGDFVIFQSVFGQVCQ